MSTTHQTTTKKNRRVSLVGFAALSGDAIHIRVPDATYVLAAYAWGGPRIRGHAWGTEINRIALENEIGAYSVSWISDTGVITISDLAEDRKFCIREADLMNISPGQMIPVYGRDNPAWKYQQPIIRTMERALPEAA